MVDQNLEVDKSFSSSNKLFYYSIHKDVNLPWLQSIPSHWGIYRGKIFLESIDQRSTTGDEELLTVSSKQGVIPRKDATVTMFKAESYAGYKLCWPNDLVINSLWAWANGLGVSKYHGIISSAYGVYRITKKDLISPKFLHLLVRSSPFQWELQVRSKGIWTSRLQLTDESFLNAPFPLPPLKEQNAIVRFLDYTDRRIKRYIRAKQKMIKLLEEEKQAIIYRTVTRGLNEEVRFKPSGIDWIDFIPENWEVLPGKTCFLVSKTSNSGLIEQTVLSLSYGKIIVKPEEKLHGLVPTSFETYQIIDKNDIIVRPTDLQNDKVSLRFGLSTQRGIITSAYLCLKTKEKLYPQYGFLFLHCLDLNKTIYRLGSGLRQNLRWEDFKYLPILLPPLQEQLEISNFINSSNKKIEEQIHLLRLEISLLNEYRTRLIADVVTGKLDVREAAAQLPEELEDIEDIEEADVEDEEELQEELDP